MTAMDGARARDLLSADGPDHLALSVRDLTVRFGPTVALENVNLDVPTGSSVAVLGPNGCGKSTLFDAIVGVVEPSHGRIELGVPRLAYMPQSITVEPMLPVTVADVVRMGRWGDLGWLARLRPTDHQHVAAALAELEITDIAEQRFGTLSGGQRQRALLAQVLAQEADLLLLDEPLTGVDAPTAELVRGLTRRWSKRGATVMVATHDLVAARRDYDLVLALDRRVVAFGPAEKVCAEETLRVTFRGHVARVGETLIDTAHHHPGAA